jgi:hypothetical protein
MNYVRPPYAPSLRFVLMQSSHIRVQLPSGRFPSGFPAGMLYAYLVSSVCDEFHAGKNIDSGSCCTAVQYAGLSRFLLLIIWSVKFCFLPYEHFNMCVGSEVLTAVVMNISLGYKDV